MSMRNMVAMFGAMAVLRRVDQEEPLVLLYARVGYLFYIGITAFMYIILHFRILKRHDTTLITIPLAPKTPSFSETMEQARKKAEAEKQRAENENQQNEDENENENENENDAEEEEEEESTEKTKEEEGEKTETITIMEYDLRHLATARRGWVTSSCFLAAVHYHMQSVSPLVMSAVMGIIRLLTEEPLIQIHLRGTPAVDKLARPFTPEKNPLASMLQDLAPKDSNQQQVTNNNDNSSTTTSTITNDNNSNRQNINSNSSSATQQQNQNPADDHLHDDGDDDDDDDDDEVPATNLRDDHIKSDFDDDEVDDVAQVSEEQKKAQ